MSDGFALAALGFALRFHIERSIREHDVAVTGNFAVSADPPERSSATPPTLSTLTLYPYQLVRNVSWSSSRTPAVLSTGERRENRWLALEVRYLLCGYGTTAAQIELLLGLALLSMHEMPRLTPAMLETVAEQTEFPTGSPLPGSLRALADQPAPLHVHPLTMELEPLSQLWSMMHGGLRTGMAYEVGTLLIEQPRRRTVAPAALEARLGVNPFRQPQISRALFAPPDAGDDFVERSIVSPGERMRLIGSGLMGEQTRLLIGGRTLVVPPSAGNAERLEMTLPADLRPGLTSLQLVHRVRKPPGEAGPLPTATIPGERSNLLPLAIRPVLDDPPVTLSEREEEDGVVRFTATAAFTVPVGARQRAELLLTGVTPDADGELASYSFLAAAPSADTPAAEASVDVRVFTIAGVRPDAYLVRLVIDGADSALTRAAAGYDGPRLTVPA